MSANTKICLHGGTWLTTDQTCVCPIGYEGERCEIETGNFLDIAWQLILFGLNKLDMEHCNVVSLLIYYCLCIKVLLQQRLQQRLMVRPN